MLAVIYSVDGIFSGFVQGGSRGIWLSPKPPESPTPNTPMQPCHVVDYNRAPQGGGGGPMLYAMWLFYGFAICYNKIFNTAIINFQLLLCKNVMVLYGPICYEKNIYTKKHLNWYGTIVAFHLGFYLLYNIYISDNTTHGSQPVHTTRYAIHQ